MFLIGIQVNFPNIFPTFHIFRGFHCIFVDLDSIVPLFKVLVVHEHNIEALHQLISYEAC